MDRAPPLPAGHGGGVSGQSAYPVCCSALAACKNLERIDDQFVLVERAQSSAFSRSVWDKTRAMSGSLFRGQDQREPQGRDRGHLFSRTWGNGTFATSFAAAPVNPPTVVADHLLVDVLMLRFGSGKLVHGHSVTSWFDHRASGGRPVLGSASPQTYQQGAKTAPGASQTSSAAHFSRFGRLTVSPY
jgi:hypothetical protein